MIDKTCQNCKGGFSISPDDKAYYEKISVPEPTWCPECRAIRRMAQVYHRRLYKRQCDVPGHTETIITIYPPDAGITVYDNEHWSSDNWDATDYARDYDYQRSFFEQFYELLREVPREARDRISVENSEYSQGGYIKNCYLCFNTGYTEGSSYCKGVQKGRGCYDLSDSSDCESCYYSDHLDKCASSLFSIDCSECMEVSFCRDCVGCSYCFGCSGLRNKKYQIFNREYSKDEYEKIVSRYMDGSWSGLLKAKAEVGEFWLNSPVRHAYVVRSQDSTGDYIYNSANVEDSFEVREAEGNRYTQYCIFGPSADCMDCSYVGINVKEAYESIGGGMNMANAKFTARCIEGYNLEYSLECWNCHDVFGCVGLRDKSFCIFNKQYTEEEYAVEKRKIIEQMKEVAYIDKNGRSFTYGEFLPIEFSPYKLDHTLAKPAYNLSQDTMKRWGYELDGGRSDSRHEPTLNAEDLPDNIADCGDGLLKEIIGCEHEGKCEGGCLFGFKLTPTELGFYREMRLPVPRLCFYCRGADIEDKQRPLRLHDSRCDCPRGHDHGGERCAREYKTTYHPDAPDIVYCDICYKEEIQ